MKILTFNIRTDFARQVDGENSWPFRKSLVIDEIRNEKPDVISFQELTANVIDDLKYALTDYAFVGCGRGKNLDDEFVSFAYLKDKYTLYFLNTEWLSNTPNVPGSKYLDEHFPRTISTMKLIDNETKKRFVIINTHLDHEKAEVRKLEALQIEKYLNSINEENLYFMGDLNSLPEDEVIKIISRVNNLTDYTYKLPYTFHAFGKVQDKIDYIFGPKNNKDYEITLFGEQSEKYLSDHHGIILTIKNV